jgi:hypothetical protein
MASADRVDVDITDAKLVVIVGCLGLGANIFGLLLFHGMCHLPDKLPCTLRLRLRT